MNCGSAIASSYTAVSSSIAAMSDSGMYRPPNSPKKGPLASRSSVTWSPSVGCAAGSCARLEECSEGRDGVSRDERLSDQHDVRARRAVVRDVRRREHGRLRDLDGTGRDALRETPEQVAVQL